MKQLRDNLNDFSKGDFFSLGQRLELGRTRIVVIKFNDWDNGGRTGECPC